MAEFAEQAAAAGLIFARCGPLVAIAPPLNVRAVPVTVRVGVAALLAVALLPVAPVEPTGAVGPMLYVALLVREAAVGAALGLAAALVFWAFTIAGQLIDGFLGAEGAGPQGWSGGPMTALLYLLAATILLAADGHHWLLAALAEGLRVLPVGAPLALGGLPEVADAVRVMLGSGLALAAPTLAALYAAEVALASFERLAPGLGLTEAGGAVRWTTGLLALAASLPVLGSLVAEHGTAAARALLAAATMLSGGA